MPGTKEGGLRAARTNKKRYGAEFYPMIGRMGGLKSRGGGFQWYQENNPEKLKEWGRRGGSKGHRA